jgi:hypothetical protein
MKRGFREEDVGWKGGIDCSGACETSSLRNELVGGGEDIEGKAKAHMFHIMLQICNVSTTNHSTFSMLENSFS